MRLAPLACLILLPIAAPAATPTATGQEANSPARLSVADAVILGVVEGVTEFLPVSSTGHLLLTEHLLKLKESDLFNIVIQCGAVLAVLPLFPERLKQFLLRWREAETRDYLLKILAAFAIRLQQVTLPTKMC